MKSRYIKRNQITSNQNENIYTKSQEMKMYVKIHAVEKKQEMNVLNKRTKDVNNNKST